MGELLGVVNHHPNLRGLQPQHIGLVFRLFLPINPDNTQPLLPSLKPTASLPLKINGWKMKFLLVPKAYFQWFSQTISFRECVSSHNSTARLRRPAVSRFLVTLNHPVEKYARQIPQFSG